MSYHDCEDWDCQQNITSNAFGIATLVVGDFELVIVDAREGEGRIAVLQERIPQVLHVSSALLLLVRVPPMGAPPDTDFSLSVCSIDGTCITVLNREHHFIFDRPDGSLVFLRFCKDGPNMEVTVTPDGMIQSRIKAFGEFVDTIQVNDEDPISFMSPPIKRIMSPNRRYFASVSLDPNTPPTRYHHHVCNACRKTCPGIITHKTHLNPHLVKVFRTADFRQVAAYPLHEQCEISIDDEGRVFVCISNSNDHRNFRIYTFPRVTD